MSQTPKTAVVGIDIGKNSFHVVGQDERSAILLRQKWSRGQVAARFGNMPPCWSLPDGCGSLKPQLELSPIFSAVLHTRMVSGKRAWGINGLGFAEAPRSN